MLTTLKTALAMADMKIPRKKFGVFSAFCPHREKLSEKFESDGIKIVVGSGCNYHPSSPGDCTYALCPFTEVET